MKADADVNLPETLETGLLQTDAEMAVNYAELTADFNPIHLDEDFAARTSFGTPIIHGTSSLNLLIRAIEDTFGESLSAFELDGRFVRPVHVGATIMAGGTLKDSAKRTYEVFVDTDAGERSFEGTLTLGPRLAGSR